MLKLKPGNSVAQCGQSSLENDETLRALEGVIHRHKMREHDLASETIMKRAKLAEQALAEARELTGGD
jgi:hypothetical protein